MQKRRTKHDFVGNELAVGDDVVGMYVAKIRKPGCTSVYKTKAPTLAFASVVRTDQPERIMIRWKEHDLLAQINPDRVVKTAAGKGE